MPVATEPEADIKKNKIPQARLENLVFCNNQGCIIVAKKKKPASKYFGGGKTIHIEGPEIRLELKVDVFQVHLLH